jgi:hypothetical protein
MFEIGIRGGKKNKVFVLCGIVGKRAFIAPVISVVGA